jgi:hypothetical protein
VSDLIAEYELVEAAVGSEDGTRGSPGYAPCPPATALDTADRHPLEGGVAAAP